MLNHKVVIKSISGTLSVSCWCYAQTAVAEIKSWSCHTSGHGCRYVQRSYFRSKDQNSSVTDRELQLVLNGVIVQGEELDGKAHRVSLKWPWFPGTCRLTFSNQNVAHWCLFQFLANIIHQVSHLFLILGGGWHHLASTVDTLRSRRPLSLKAHRRAMPIPSSLLQQPGPVYAHVMTQPQHLRSHRKTWTRKEVCKKWTQGEFFVSSREKRN